MRARVYSNGGTSTGGFTFNGGQLTGALILAGNPGDPLEAAAKQYVDSSLVNLNAGNLTSGILPAGRLPVFSGDIVKPAGSSSINLAPIGITAGDYTKPTVDAKGRVTAGAAILEADLPNISWNKVTTGKPTTAEGYGITDALTTAGGTLSGFLTFNGSVTGTMQAVTKQYVDVTLSSSTGIAIGDIIRKPYGNTPSGFLKCNGALVSKTTYNALYATINNRFNKQQAYTNSRPWSQQYNINETQINDISNWTTNVSVLPEIASLGAFIVTKNRVYLLGFYSSTGASQTVYTAVINADGSLGSWTVGTALPAAVSHSVVIVIKNRVYLIGGLNSGSHIAGIYTAVINSNGTLGTWSASGSLPAALSHSRAIVTNSRVYLLGGISSAAAISTVYTAPINSDGTLGTWTTGTSLPLAVFEHEVFITKNRVYLVGGHTAWPSPVTAAVYSAPINTDGTLGSWSAELSLPIAMGSFSVFVTKNTVYLFGGHNGTSMISSVYYAKINADGSLGTWKAGSNLPNPLGQSECLAVKNILYLIGGTNASSGTAAILSANITGGLNDYSKYYSEDSTNYLMPGSGRPWQQQYQINQTQTAEISSWTTTTTFPTVVGNQSMFVTKNRVYSVGGSNGSVVINNVYYAAINADGTLGTWTASTAFPVAIGATHTVITKNRVYILCGSNGTLMQNSIYFAAINADGSIGEWTSAGTMPLSVSYAMCFVTKNRVYIIGGWNGSSYHNSVYTAIINSDGSLGSWSAGTNFPTAIMMSQVAIVKNKVYIIGGHNGSAMLSSVYVATINSDGLIGPWTLYTALPITHGYSQVFVTNKRIYLISGSNGSTNINNIYTAIINEDGSLGNWVLNSSTIPFGNYYHSVFATKNKLYSVGGFNGATYMNTVHMASILESENDYSPYYDGTITPADTIDPSTTFALPDLSQSEKFDTVSYIKY